MPIDWANIISSAAQVAGAAAAARGQGRANQAVIQQGQDRNTLDAFTTEQAVKQRALEAIDSGRLSRALGQLNEYQLGLDAPGKRASSSVRGDILANVQDVTASHPRANVVNFSGGLRPSLLSGKSRALGSEMSREALISQLKGTPTPYASLPETDYSSILGSKAPQPTALPGESTMDKILGAIGTYGSLAGAVGGAMKPRPTVAGQIAKQPAGTPGTATPFTGFTPEELALLNPQRRSA